MMHIGLSTLSSSFKNTAYISADGGGDEGDPRNFVFGEFINGHFKDKIQFSGKETLASFHAYVSDAIGMSGGENGKTSGLAAYGTINKELENNLSKFLITKNKYNIFFNRKGLPNKINLDKVKPQEYDRGKIMNTYPSNTNIFKSTKKYLPQDIALAAENIVSNKFLKILKLLKKKLDLIMLFFLVVYSVMYL